MDYGENEWLESTSNGNDITYRRCTESMQTSNSFPGCQVVAGNRPAEDLQWWGKDGDGNAVLMSGIPEEDVIRIPGSQQFIIRDNPLFRHPSTLRVGTATDLNLSVRGGTGVMGYFLSFNKNDEDGVYFNNFSKRIGGRDIMLMSYWDGGYVTLDVTNPAARTQSDSPIYGMPILNVDESGAVIVLKRSMASGFAGIDNPLFYDPKTSMLFGDAKKSVDAVASVSLRAESIRCAMYPPPPGSEPGYQTLHHCTVSGMTSSET